MKKLITAILTIAMLLSQTAFAQDDLADKVTVTLDGIEIAFPDAQPFVDKRDRTLVPIRFVSESMGAEVSWNNDTQTATIVKGRDTINYTIGEVGGYLNGVKYPFDTVGILKEDRTLVPLRFISELLNCKVDWIQETKTVIITSPPAPMAFPEPEITLHFPESPNSGKLFWITLDNLRDYSDCDNYQFKIDFITPAEFNTIEVNEGAINGWQIHDANQWRKITISGTSIFSASSKYYTTRENKEKLNLYEGMPLEYVLSVKRMCSGEIKEYTYTDTFQYPYPAQQ